MNPASILHSDFESIFSIKSETKENLIPLLYIGFSIFLLTQIILAFYWIQNIKKGRRIIFMNFLRSNFTLFWLIFLDLFAISIIDFMTFGLYCSNYENTGFRSYLTPKLGCVYSGTSFGILDSFLTFSSILVLIFLIYIMLLGIFFNHNSRILNLRGNLK